MKSHPIPIVDAHHHIWRMDKTPWLQGPMIPRIFGEYGAIRRDYTIGEFSCEAKPCGVVKSVYIQVNVAPEDAEWEVKWALEEGKKTGLINAVVSFADLSDPRIGDVLDRQTDMGNMRGVRQQLHWHKNSLYKFADRPDLMSDPDWQRGLKEVGARGLHFELQIFENQYQYALELISKFPDITFVLLHCGMPEDVSERAIKRWSQGLSQFAERENVLAKISGLGTFSRSYDVSEKRPLIERTVDIFGPDRCIFGSNFPIEKLWIDYENLIGAVRQCLSGYSPEEQRAVLHDTACKLYQI